MFNNETITLGFACVNTNNMLVRFTRQPSYVVAMDEDLYLFEPEEFEGLKAALLYLLDGSNAHGAVCDTLKRLLDACARRVDDEAGRPLVGLSAACAQVVSEAMEQAGRRTR